MKALFLPILSSLFLTVSATEYTQRENPVSTYGPIRSLSWSPDGSQFVVCCQKNSTAHIMTSTGGSRRGIPSTNKQGNARCVAWSPSPYIAVGTDQGKIDVWSTAIEKRKSLLTYPEEAPNHWVSQPVVLSLAWNPKEKVQLAVGYDTSALCVWDTLKQKQKLRSIFRHAGKVNTVAWSPDGRLASGADDNTIRIWNCDVRTCLQELRMEGVQSICWRPSGSMLVAGGVEPGRLSNSPVIKVWDLDSDTSVATAKELNESVNSVDWSMDGLFIAVGANKGRVHLLGSDSRDWRQGFECKESAPLSAEKTTSGKSTSYNATASVSLAQSESGEVTPQISFSLDLNLVKTLFAYLASRWRNPPAVKDVKWNSKGELAAGNKGPEGRVFVYVPKTKSSPSCWEKCIAVLCCCCRKSKTQ